MQKKPDVAADVDGYIAGFPDRTRTLLRQMRATIRKAAPDAEECISYQMPAYKYRGMLVYFAGYGKHIGFYPGAAGIAHFKHDIAGYKNAKGSVQFPLDKPLPLRLVAKITAFRAMENETRKKPESQTKTKAKAAKAEPKSKAKAKAAKAKSAATTTANPKRKG